MRGYALTLLSLLVGAIIAIASINLFIDPYDVVHGPGVAGLNANKTRTQEDGGRIMVSGRLVDGGLESAVFGSSRTVDGFPRFAGDWPGGLFNAGMRGSNAFETTRAMALAARDPGLRCIVVGLDLDEFGDHGKTKATYWLTPFADGSRLLSLARMALSPQTLLRSLQTIYDNAAGSAPPPPFRDEYKPGEQYERYTGMIDKGVAFAETYQLDEERLQYFGAALDRLTAEGVQVIAFLHPIHAWREEIVFRAVGEIKYFAFRRELAAMFDQYRDREAAYPCTPGPAATLWDFAGYQDFASTPPPGAAQTAGQPYFHEPAHYLPSVGEAILARIQGKEGDGLFASSRFGLRLTPENAAASEDKIRDRRARWLETPSAEDLTKRLEAAMTANQNPAPPARSYLTGDDWRDLEEALAKIPQRSANE